MCPKALVSRTHTLPAAIIDTFIELTSMIERPECEIATGGYKQQQTGRCVVVFLQDGYYRGRMHVT